MKNLLVLYGTRPEAVKMAPLVAECGRAVDLRTLVCVTGQHRSMLDQVNALFGIKPDYDLDIFAHGQTLSDVTSSVLAGMRPIFENQSIAAVVVQGDTTSTMAGALAAFYAQVPVVHVEAGLRTGNRYSPFPEEMNRRLTSQLADLHLAPTATASANLRADGIQESNIIVTGNTVIDALHLALQHNAPVRDPAVAAALGSPRRKILVTAHRRENWGAPMGSIARAVARIATTLPVEIIFAMHKNPNVRAEIVPVLSSLPNVHLVEPMDYYSFARTMEASALILSDSGGVQEEAPSLGVPVLVLRDNTERPEAIDAGTACLVGTDESTIVKKAEDLLTDEAQYASMSRAVNPYGDGRAASRSVEAIRAMLHGTPLPVPFYAD